MTSRWAIAVAASLLLGLTACESSPPPQTSLDKTAACAAFKTMRSEHESKVLPDLRKLRERSEEANFAQLKKAVLENTAQHAEKSKAFAATVGDAELKLALENYAADFDDMDVYITALIPRGKGETAMGGFDSGMPGLPIGDVIQQKCEGKVTRSKELTCFQYRGIDGLAIQHFLMMAAFDEAPDRPRMQQAIDRWVADISRAVAQLAEQTEDPELKAAMQADAKYYEGLKTLLADASKDPAKANEAMGMPAHAGVEVCLK